MAGDEGKAHWIDPECDALLDGLIAKKSTHQSGNGFKPTVWAEIVKDVHAANPGVRPKKDQTTLQKGFEKYIFVQKYSGIGWDSELHMVTATEGVISRSSSSVHIRMCRAHHGLLSLPH
ncbi:hypothetical protein B0H14DRAFT_3539199 [Mycena olivaceomarginata]|nr:hypothetical protein B0H14DRAFT_3539199 [Mycena olivaceomarginata]